MAFLERDDGPRVWLGAPKCFSSRLRSPQTMKPKTCSTPLIGWVAFLLATALAVHAAEGIASPGYGVISGRVINQATKAALEAASVHLEGTAVTTFTDRDG